MLKVTKPIIKACESCKYYIKAMTKETCCCDLGYFDVSSEELFSKGIWQNANIQCNGYNEGKSSTGTSFEGVEELAADDSAIKMGFLVAKPCGIGTGFSVPWERVESVAIHAPTKVPDNGQESGEMWKCSVEVRDVNLPKNSATRAWAFFPNQKAAAKWYGEVQAELLNTFKPENRISEREKKLEEKVKDLDHRLVQTHRELTDALKELEVYRDAETYRKRRKVGLYEMIEKLRELLEWAEEKDFLETPDEEV